MNRTARIVIVSMLCFWYSVPNTLAAPVGVKLGFTASTFYYTDRTMDPYLGFDIDLRPYLGYDIEWVQLGNQKPLFSPNIGCYLDYSIADRIILRPEIGITQKGVVFNQYDYERIIYEVRLTYVHIPLTIGYQALKTDHYIFELYAGGAAAFKLHASKRVGSHDSRIQSITLDNVRKFDFSLLFGFNVKWDLIGKTFMCDVQGFYGLTDIFDPIDNQARLYHHTQKTKITCISLSLAYEFTK